MNKLSWKEYYENFGMWSESDQIDYLYRIEEFGPHDEVSMLASGFDEEKYRNKIIEKALECGVKFNADDLYLLFSCIDKELFIEALKTLTDTFTSEQIKEFMKIDLSPNTLERMMKTSTE